MVSKTSLTLPGFEASFGLAIAPYTLGTTPRGVTTMAKPILPDELWAVIEPLLPKWTPAPREDSPPSPTGPP